MKQRIITGSILTIFVGLFIGFSHVPYVINTFTFILSAFCIYEVLKVTNNLNNNYSFVPFIADAVISYINIPYYYLIISVLFIACILIFFYMMKNIDTYSLKEKYKSFLFSAYIPLAFRALTEIRCSENGLFLLITTIVVTALTDIFAHLCGKTFGKKKSFPKISPSKTIEGSLSGIFVTLIVSQIIFITLGVCTKTSTFFLSTIFLMFLSLVGEFGDLSMSSIKRIQGVKDYSNILPGHGGVLDRFDSLLFTAPYVLIFTHFINLW